MGKGSPGNLCQNLLIVVKQGSDGNSVDPSDFIKGCLDGYQHALKEI